MKNPKNKMTKTKWKLNLSVEVKAQKNATHRTVRLEIDDEIKHVPVSEALFEKWKQLVLRKQPTERQRELHAMVLGLMRAAYGAGGDDGGPPSAPAARSEAA